VTEETTTSVADVPTNRAARYGKQLVSHLSRRSSGEWDDAAETGMIEFGDGRAALSAGPEALHLEVTGPSERIGTLEDVVGSHLVRFGTRDELVVRWARADGTPGSVQEGSAD
jgi:hypothetical protein